MGGDINLPCLLINLPAAVLIRWSTNVQGKALQRQKHLLSLSNTAEQISKDFSAWSSIDCVKGQMRCGLWKAFRRSLCVSLSKKVHRLHIDLLPCVPFDLIIIQVLAARRRSRVNIRLICLLLCYDVTSSDNTNRGIIVINRHMNEGENCVWKGKRQYFRDKQLRVRGCWSILSTLH